MEGTLLGHLGVFGARWIGGIEGDPEEDELGIRIVALGLCTPKPAQRAVYSQRHALRMRLALFTLPCFEVLEAEVLQRLGGELWHGRSKKGWVND